MHYYVDCGAIQIVAKGFSYLEPLSKVKNATLASIIDSTATKSLISSAKKTGFSVPAIINMVYDCILKGEAETTKPLDRRLVTNAQETELSEKQLDEIISTIENKRKYKHVLLDCFVYLLKNLDNSNNLSIELHQEIARYLGVDKRDLGRIHSTSKGDKVRSKSEVIIANLLHEYKIEYEYELPLDYGGKEPIRPDFTIFLSDGSKLFWEHLGMLGSEKYDRDWLFKMNIYEKYFPRQLLKTYEGVAISESALDLIEEIKKRS